MLTNKLNLPEPFLRAYEAKAYDKGPGVRYSASELIQPARLAALRRLYADVIVEDVADCMPSLIGTMFHLMLERAGAPQTGAILEERLYADVDGIRISGAMDHTLLWEDGTLDDYKSCSVYAVRGGHKFEWEAQTNIYRWFRALHGQKVERLRVIAWMRDWMISRAIAAAANPEGAPYPPHEIAVVEIPVWPLEQTEAYIKERIAEHVAADRWAADMNSHAPGERAFIEPLCTDEERWREKVQWAVMREGRKTAIKKYDSKEEAEFVASQTKGGYIEIRGGTYKRCLLYCPAGRAGLCTQWERDKAESPHTAVIDTSAFD